MRNKFISDFIFEVTGVRRTPKQVGSRLQQLRDTCEGKRSESSSLTAAVRALPPLLTIILFLQFSSSSPTAPMIPRSLLKQKAL